MKWKFKLFKRTTKIYLNNGKKIRLSTTGIDKLVKEITDGNGEFLHCGNTKGKKLRIRKSFIYAVGSINIK